MQFWPELTYKLYANSNVSCMRDVRDPMIAAIQKLAPIKQFFCAAHTL